MEILTAKNLKNHLWSTMQELSNGQTSPDKANAMASQAREILRTVKIQLQVANHAQRPLSTEAIDFAEK